MKIYTITESEMIHLKQSIRTLIEEMKPMLETRHKASDFFIDTDIENQVLELSDVLDSLDELKAGELRLSTNDINKELEVNHNKVVVFWGVNDIHNKVDIYNEENGTDYSITDAEAMTIIKKVFSDDLDTSSDSEYLTEEVERFIDLLPKNIQASKANLEQYLIYAWNDYVSEVDEKPNVAKVISDVDLKLEGFYNRHQDDIDKYESL